MDGLRDVSNICFLLHTRDVCWEERGVHDIHSSGRACQGPDGEVIHSGGPSEDDFYEIGACPPPTAASLLLPSPGYPAQLPEQPGCLHLQ